jgi:hypothetical protein
MSNVWQLINVTVFDDSHIIVPQRYVTVCSRAGKTALLTTSKELKDFSNLQFALSCEETQTGVVHSEDSGQIV